MSSSGCNWGCRCFDCVFVKEGKEEGKVFDRGVIRLTTHPVGPSFTFLEILYQRQAQRRGQPSFFMNSSQFYDHFFVTQAPLHILLTLESLTNCESATENPLIWTAAQSQTSQVITTVAPTSPHCCQNSSLTHQQIPRSRNTSRFKPAARHHLPLRTPPTMLNAAKHVTRGQKPEK